MTSPNTPGCFGGAGGQHACLVADALGMKTVILHPFAGVLSAYGMGLADIRADRQQAVSSPRQPGRAQMTHRLDGPALLHLRYDGTDTTLPVLLGTGR
jgi:5-oxoprolinase (ATP-hydrolysing)